MHTPEAFFDAPKIVREYTSRQRLPIHEEALSVGRDRALRIRPDCIVIVAFGSVARGDTGPFSDVDIASVVPTTEATPTRVSFLHEDIVVNLSFFDLTSFVEAFGTRDPWEAMWKSILIQGENALVLYDPSESWPRIAEACLIEEETDLLVEVLSTFWTGCIIYLAKLVNAAIEGDYMYAVESGGILARNACYIVLALNRVPPISNRYLRIQSSKCSVRPPHYLEDFDGLYGINTSHNLWLMAQHGVRLCREIQNVLQELDLPSGVLPTLGIDFRRYEAAIEGSAPDVLCQD